MWQGLQHHHNGNVFFNTVSVLSMVYNETFLVWLLTCWHSLHSRHKRKVCTLFVQRRKNTLVWMPCSVPLLFSLSMGRLKTRLVVWPQLLFLLQARMSEYRRFHSQSYSRCLGIQSRRKDGRYLIYHHNKTFSDDCGSFQPRKLDKMKIGWETLQTSKISLRWRRWGIFKHRVFLKMDNRSTCHKGMSK